MYTHFEFTIEKILIRFFYRFGDQHPLVEDDNITNHCLDLCGRTTSRWNPRTQQVFIDCINRQTLAFRESENDELNFWHKTMHSMGWTTNGYTLFVDEEKQEAGCPRVPARRAQLALPTALELYDPSAVRPRLARTTALPGAAYPATCT